MKTETFSYLPPLSEEEIRAQIAYFLNQRCVIGVEYSPASQSKRSFWDWWKLPLFTLNTVDEVLAEVQACQAAHPDCYIRLTAYDQRQQREVMEFMAYIPGSNR